MTKEAVPPTSTDLSARLPRHNEFPNISLYMDQVLTIIDTSIAPFTPNASASISRAMVNNYVKQKLVPPSQKKMYTADHLSRLIIITLLKRTLSMEQIALVMEDLLIDRTVDDAYDLFCDEFEHNLSQSVPVTSSQNCPELLAFALQSLTGKIKLEAAIQEMHPTIEIKS